MLHYHLRPGGVTTVIRNAQRALARKFEVEVLADFGYDDDPRTFQRRVRDYMRRLPRTGILHTHNVGLGKNPALTCAVKRLAETGRVKIINQVHDFPEDNRPTQLRALRRCKNWQALCYYDLPNVIWATLTSHDAGKLAARGIPAKKIHVLPNPLDDKFFSRPDRIEVDVPRPFLLSPMKVMKRKNNAEAVGLVQQLGRYHLVISLDADNDYAAELKRRIRRERLPVIIGAGLDDPLPLFRAAHAILTTSKQEGFGYAFLEGWLCSKLVVGRDIPEVTADFKAAGMKLDHLYQTPDADVLRRLLARPPRNLIDHNRRVVLENYSLRAYTRRYEKLLGKFSGRL